MVKLTIGVDIDDTLTQRTRKKISENYREYYKRLYPMSNFIEKLRQIKKRGHIICLFTSRRLEDREITIRWLRKHKVPYNHIIFDKPLFDLYIDNDAQTGTEVDLAFINYLCENKNKKPWEEES